MKVKMGIEEKIKIIEVRELDSNADEWEKKIAQRLKSKIQKYQGQFITLDFLDSLLEHEGVREEAWANVISFDDRPECISYRILPLTENRKKFFRERGKQDPSSVLYLRKQKKFPSLWATEFRIGVFEVYWVPAGMGIRPEFEKFQDLLAIKYK